MENRAIQVVPFPSKQQERTSTAKRHPDTISLALELQTTLDLEAQLNILFTEIAHYIQLDGASYVHNELQVNLRIKDVARHSCSYNLELLGSELGTLEFSRGIRFSEADLEIIEYLLSAALYPLNNAINYHKALKLAQRDPLTGIANRLSMDETIQREINRAQRYKLPLSMLMIDLDHFKAVNDNYGHSTGDKVIQEAALKIQEALRLSDHAFRFGGEEFAVLLTDTNLEDAQIVAERIRENIANTNVSNNEFNIKFTVSIGVTELKEGDSQQNFFNHADDALYLAKSEGRNCISAWKESYRD
ncbi:MAG: GGDEF domain-containing protein [Chromatiales bacterium]|nr:GGDEF domain-containing protein [Chromatiales bacterium]